MSVHFREAKFQIFPGEHIISILYGDTYFKD